MEFFFNTFEEAFNFLTSEEGLGLRPEMAARALAGCHVDNGVATWYESPDFPIRSIKASPKDLRDYHIEL